MQQIEKKEDLLFFVFIWKFFRLICHIQSHFRPIFTLKNCVQNRPAKMILKMLRFKEYDLWLSNQTILQRMKAVDLERRNHTIFKRKEALDVRDK